MVEQESGAVAELGQQPFGAHVPVAVGVRERARRATEQRGQPLVRVHHLGPDVRVGTPIEQRMGERVVLHPHAPRLQRAQIGRGQLRGDQRSVALAQVREQPQPGLLRHGLEVPEPPGTRARRLARHPRAGPDQPLDLVPPERCPAPDRRGHHEGHTRNPALAQQRQTVLQDAALTVVEGQQHGPGRQRPPTRQGLLHLVEGHRSGDPPQPIQLARERVRVRDPVIPQHREPQPSATHEPQLRRGATQQHVTPGTNRPRHRTAHRASPALRLPLPEP